MLNPPNSQIEQIVRAYHKKTLRGHEGWFYRGEVLTTHLEHIQRLNKGIQFPGVLHIDVTNHCNRKCDFCFFKDRYSENIFPLGYMDFDVFKAIIDEAKKYFPGQPEIHLHKDGEPLLHPQIGEMVKYAKANGCFTHFATNGFKLFSLRETIVNSGLDLLTVSMVDDKALENLTAFLEFKGDRKPKHIQLIYNWNSRK